MNLHKAQKLYRERNKELFAKKQGESAVTTLKKILEK